MGRCAVLENAPLPHNEALELIREAQAGDTFAEEKLIVHNSALVKSIVKKFLGRGVDFEDLFQIGSLGLVKAIKNYDEAYNVRFSTYAVPMIIGEIKRFMRDDGMIKVSRSMKEIAAKAASERESLHLKFGREPTLSEIAQAMNIEKEDLAVALDASKACVSLHDSVYDDDSGTILLERMTDKDADESVVVDKILLKELLRQLEVRERQIIMLRYFQDKTQNEIAKLLGISQVQVSRLESKIILKLRKAAQ